MWLRGKKLPDPCTLFQERCLFSCGTETYDANLKDYNLLATTRGNCEVPHRCSTLGQTAVSVKGNKYSNSFPVAIKERSTLPTFKTQLKPCTFDHLTSIWWFFVLFDWCNVFMWDDRCKLAVLVYLLIFLLFFLDKEKRK